MEKGNFHEGMLKKIAFVIFFCELLFWILINISTNFLRDFDFAGVVYHSMKMWEGKSLVLPNWTYSTTGEWDCASLLAMPLYGILKDIFLAFGIANIINVLALSLLIIALMKVAGAKEAYAYLAIDIILLPYAAGMLSYTNMLFWGGAQYIYKVLIPMLLIYLLHNHMKSKYFKICLTTIMLFLLFMTVTSSGLFVVVCGIVPIVAMEFCYFMINKHNVGKIQILILALVIVDIMISIIFHNHWGISSNADSMSIVTIRNLSSNFYDCIMDNICIFEIFSYQNVAALSLDGIKILLKLFIHIFILFFGLRYCGKLKKVIDSALLGRKSNEKSEDRSVIKAELLAVAICNYVVTVLTLSGSRYQLIGFIPLILVAVLEYEDINYTLWVKCIVMSFILFAGILLAKDFMEVYPETYYSKDICYDIINLARKENVDQVISYNEKDWSQILRVYGSDIDFISYNAEEACFRDIDVYNGEKALESFNRKSIMIVYNGVKPSVDGYTEDYELLTFIGPFAIYKN